MNDQHQGPARGRGHEAKVEGGKVEGGKVEAEEVEADEVEAGARVTADGVIPAALAGSRLDAALARLWPEHSRARLQRWLKAGAVRLDGAVVAPRTRVLGDERVTLDAWLEADERWVPQPIAFDVLHEDAALLLVDKPAGLVVHPGAGNADGTLVNGLLHRYAELARVPRAGIVHRLDKDTSGVLAVARTIEAHTRLVEQLAARSVRREYLALTEGVPTGGTTVDAPIGRDPHNRLRMAVDTRGREAITQLRVALRFRGHALVRCRLETGRTHQIRVHLKHLGYPLLGDRLYGARGRLPSAPTPALVEAVQGFRRQALHAHRIELEHPQDGERVGARAPLPDDLVAMLRVLAIDAGIGEDELRRAVDGGGAP